MKAHIPQHIASASNLQMRAATAGGYMAGAHLAPVYGTVVAQNWDGTVDVEARSGVILTHLPVLSQDYASDKGDKAVGKKRLPLVGAYVLVMFPGGLPETGIVMGSYLDPVSEKQRAELLVEGEESIDRSRNEAGWQEEYQQKTGIFTLKDDNGFIMTVDPEAQTITLTDWHGNTWTMDSNGVQAQDANGNKVQGTSTGLKLEGADGDTLELTGGLAKVNGDSKIPVTHAELTQALSTFWAQVVTALTTTPIAGNGAPQPAWTGLPTSIDISNAKTTKVKVG